MAARSPSSGNPQGPDKTRSKLASAHAARAGERPGYLVYFRERSEENESLLRDVMSLKRAGGERAASMASSICMLETTAVTEAVQAAPQAPPRLLEKLAIGVVSPDDAQLQQLRRSPLVAAVEPNERRYVQIESQSELLAGGVAAVRRVHEDRMARLAAAGPLWSDPFARSGGAEIGAFAPSRYDGYAPPPDTFGPWSSAGPMRSPGGSNGHRFPWWSQRVDGPMASLDATHSWCLDHVGVHRGYARATGRGVTVAVLDTGIDLDHGDFQGRFRTDSGDPGIDTAVSFVAGEDVRDHHGHGTFCAGVVAGPTQSAGGMRYGVAPDATLLVGKVLGNDGGGWDSDILEAVEWAADRGAKVVSMSLGSKRGVERPFSEGFERIGKRLFEEQGVLLVAAAGNESRRPTEVAAVGNPAACPSFMAVAAVDDASQVAWFSCGQRDLVGLVDLAAPGVDVYSAVAGGYRLMSGTSMATPHVAGIAVLWLSHDPSLDPYELWWNLEQHAKPLGDVRDTGRGLVQAP